MSTWYTQWYLRLSLFLRPDSPQLFFTANHVSLCRIFSGTLFHSNLENFWCVRTVQIKCKNDSLTIYFAKFSSKFPLMGITNYDNAKYSEYFLNVLNFSADFISHFAVLSISFEPQYDRTIILSAFVISAATDSNKAIALFNGIINLFNENSIELRTHRETRKFVKKKKIINVGTDAKNMKRQWFQFIRKLVTSMSIGILLVLRFMFMKGMPCVICIHFQILFCFNSIRLCHRIVALSTPTWYSCIAGSVIISNAFKIFTRLFC